MLNMPYPSVRGGKIRETRINRVQDQNSDLFCILICIDPSFISGKNQMLIGHLCRAAGIERARIRRRFNRGLCRAGRRELSPVRSRRYINPIRLVRLFLRS